MNESENFFGIDYPDYQPLEIVLRDPENFLKIKETLSRIGVASKRDNTLYQSCHYCKASGRVGLAGDTGRGPTGDMSSQSDQNNLIQRKRQLEFSTEV
jgi:hypothetical protein